MDKSVGQRPFNTRTALLKEQLLDPSDDTVFIVAHRGEWSNAPENSAKAIEEAISAGAHIVEIDVRRTSDGEWLVIHDNSFDRTTNGTGRIDQSADGIWRYLRLRERGGGSDTALTDYSILSLEDALGLTRDRILVNVDMKGAPLSGYREVGALIAELGMQDQVILKRSFDKALEQENFLSQCIFMPLLSLEDTAVVEMVANLKPVMCEVEFASLEQLEEHGAHLRAQGARLWVNTLMVAYNLDLHDESALSNPEAVWGALIDASVTVIQTDQTEALSRYLDQRASGDRAGFPK